MWIKILEFAVVAILSSMATMALSWLKIRGKIESLAGNIEIVDTKTEDIKTNFTACHNEHLNCPEDIKAACEKSVKELAVVVDSLSKTTNLTSVQLEIHLRVSKELDDINKERFIRIEQAYTAIDQKLNQLIMQRGLEK